MRDDSPNSWEARADAHSFYGFTDLPSIAERGTVVLTHGEGPYVIDVHGRRYLDANSGLWPRPRKRNMTVFRAITPSLAGCRTRQ